MRAETLWWTLGLVTCHSESIEERLSPPPPLEFDHLFGQGILGEVTDGISSLTRIIEEKVPERFRIWFDRIFFSNPNKPPLKEELYLADIIRIPGTPVWSRLFAHRDGI